MNEVTRLIDRVQAGVPQAAEELLPLVYDELRKLAAAKLAHEGADHTLQPTALVHDAWLRMVGDNTEQPWNGRGHFFGAAAEAMRRILVEAARRKHAARHGGGQVRVDLEEMDLAADAEDDRLILINDALEELAKIDPNQAEIVKMRFFVGLKVDEIAALRGVSEKTISREWNHAKAWLFEWLGENR